MGKEARVKIHSYLLLPVSGQAQTKRNRSELPLRSRTQPRIVCDMKFDQVCLSLTDVRLYFTLLYKSKHWKSIANIKLKQYIFKL